MFWSQKRIWLAYPALARIMLAFRPTQLCQHSTNILQKKYRLVDLLSLVRR